MSVEQNVGRVTFPENIQRQIDLRAAGRRKNISHGGTLCSKCLVNTPRPGQRYCKPCRNADDYARRARNKSALESAAAIARKGL
jgi:hypothetical protein